MFLSLKNIFNPNVFSCLLYSKIVYRLVRSKYAPGKQLIKSHGLTFLAPLYGLSAP